MKVNLDMRRRSGRPHEKGMTGAGAAVAAGGRTASFAAAEAERAGFLLAAIGLASSVFVLTRLFAAWRVVPDGTEHGFSVLGQRLTYPAANSAAWVVLVLAAMGLAVTLLTIVGTAREVAGARRLRRWLADAKPGLVNGALVIADERPRAFCAGLISPRVYVSTGALAALDDRALQAVLAHERHHADRRDPLRLAVGRVLSRALFCFPGLRGLVRRQHGLTELSADEHALLATCDDRPALARAMLVFSETEDGQVVGIEAARVDHLMGTPASWRFPGLLCAAAAAVSGLMVGVAVLAGELATGTATLAPPVISSKPCVVALALIPCGLTVAGALIARRRPQ